MAVMIPRWMLDQEHSFSRRMSAIASENFREAMANLRRLHETKGILLMSLMGNIIGAIGFIGVAIVDPQMQFAAKAICVMAFSLMGALALGTLIRLLR